MKVFITVQIQPDPLPASSSIMHSSVTTEDCQVLHGLHHRPSTSHIDVVSEEENGEGEAGAKVQIADGTVFPPSPNDDQQMAITHSPVEPVLYQTRETAHSGHQVKAAPNALFTIIKLASIVILCGFLIPFMHYSRTKMSAEGEACKSNALTGYEKKLAECKAVAGTNFDLEARGIFRVNWLEVFTIMAMACGWQFLTWILHERLVTRLSIATKKKRRN